ncbi:MAG: metal ABC transporter substrate-binding protein [Tenericutes bacterium]|nr:metal ABC transporter substrate-binding protein [Mycoplasmatota bacterium]
MKKIILIITMLLCLTGCFKSDSYEGINIYTTLYPIEYITKTLYGEYATINSIYPNGVDIENYTITNKKLNDFSKADLFIYNGLGNEKQIAANLIEKNKNMDIIDVAQGLEIKNDKSELLISPSNFLMMAQNIKNGLKENVKNTSIIESINNNYDDLKIKISEIDAELKLIAENAKNKKIIVANNSFKFLEKYGFEVLSISADDENSNTNLSKAKSLFSSKTNTYLFIIKGTEKTETIESLENDGAKLAEVNPMYTLTDEEIKNDSDYITILKSFIDTIKTEVY